MKKIQLAASISLMALVSACAVAPEQLDIQEMSISAENDMSLMFDEMTPISGELSLSEAIARALKYNLDHKAKAMEQALAFNQTELDKFDLLPTLTANAGYTNRNTYDATNSKTVGSSNPPGSYSYSEDKANETFDLTMGWNMLDFGVSYFNAKQNSDRALIAEERRKKVIHNLIREVQAAYWRMVAAQRMETRVARAIENAQRSLAQAERLEAERLEAPENALRFQKQLLQNLRQLETLNQNLASARIELAALINVAPGTSFRVEIPVSDTLEIPEWQASLDDMVALAFQKNPDLREKLYLSRITVNETKKSVLSLLPGINLDAGFNYDGNSFLDENRWYDMSASLSWNLFNVFKLPARQRFADANEQLAETQRLALRMALLAQVHVSDMQYRNAIKRFRQAEKLYNVERRLTDHVSRRRASRQQGGLELVSQQTAMLGAELQRYQAYSNMMAAVGRIHSTIGVGIVPKTATSNEIDDLSQSITSALDAWTSGEAIKNEVASLKQPMEVDELIEPQEETSAPSHLEKTATEQETTVDVEPKYVEFSLNNGPGEPPVNSASLNCLSLKEGDNQDGWIELSGVDAQKRNWTGWIHQVYLMQGKLECQKLMKAGS